MKKSSREKGKNGPTRSCTVVLILTTAGLTFSTAITIGLRRKEALNHLLALGKSSTDLVGYSFGAWVNALGIEKLDDAARMVMVSPPVNFIDFEFLKYNPKIELVIVGDRDEIAGHKAIERLMKTWNPEAALRIIANADHFYWGRTEELKAIIGEFLDKK